MTTRVLPLDDGDVGVHLDGPAEAPVLLLVHGTASSARSWDLLVPLLTGAYRVIRVDLLGHGRSAKPEDADYEVPAHARRVGEVLDRLGLAEAVVVGHSTGGMVATSLAEQRPGLVTALALIDTGPSREVFTGEEIPVGPEQWPHLSDEQLRAAMAHAFSRPGFRIPQFLVDELRGLTFHSLTATMGATRTYLARRAIPERLAAVGKPLLVIFGAADRRWRPESADDYRTIAGGRVVMLPAVGHSPMLEDPEATAVPLLAFAAEHV